MMKRKARKNVLLLGGPYMESLYRDIIENAIRRNWDIELEERYNPPRNWQGDGIISMLLNTPVMTSFLDDVLARDIPVVDIIGVLDRAGLGCVSTDSAALGKLAAEHFHRHNFRHAAFFAFEWTSLHQRRYEAFADAFGEPRPIKWCWPDEADRPEDRAALERWLLGKILSAPKPLAVLAFNAYNAEFLSRVCHNDHIAVPQEVAILAGYESTIHTLHPGRPISAIVHDNEGIAQKATALLGRMMSGKAAHDAAVFVKPLGITVRRSTDAIAANDPSLRSALLFVSRNISRPFGPSQVADKLGITTEHLNRITQREVGRSMLDEIRRLRIEEAKRIMKESDEKLLTVARATGFCNASFLCKTFHAVTGQTPRGWKSSVRWKPRRKQKTKKNRHIPRAQRAAERSLEGYPPLEGFATCREANTPSASERRAPDGRRRLFANPCQLQKP